MLSTTISRPARREKISIDELSVIMLHYQSINQSIIYLFEHRNNRKTTQINSEIVTNLRLSFNALLGMGGLVLVYE